MIPLSIIVITKNEESNIAMCLASCKHASEIFVVDSSSTDRTVEMAKKYIPTSHVIDFKWNGKWPKKKYWCLQNLSLSNDWVLMLDADESIPEKAWDKIRILVKQDTYNGFMVPFSYQFMDREIKFGDPVRKLCMFRHSKTIYENEFPSSSFSKFDFEGHASPLVEGRVGLADFKIKHNDYKGLYQYFSRHNDYSEWEALLQMQNHYGWLPESGDQKTENQLRARCFGNVAERRRWMKKFFMQLPLKPFFYFMYAYFCRLGFLDGKEGFFYIMGKCFYFMQIDLKTAELRQKGSHC